MNFRELNCKDIDFESWICNNNNNKEWTLGNWTARIWIFNDNNNNNNINCNNNNNKWTSGNRTARI